MRKKIIMLMLSMSIIATPMSVFAAETTSTEATSTTSAVSTEVSSEATESSTAPSGDEGAIVMAMATSQTTETPCQINVIAKLPDNFGLSVYANVKNTDTGTTYQLPLYSKNQYTQSCFVPAGKYTVQDIDVFDDTTGTYEFEYPDDFELKDKESIDLNTTLTNYDEVEEQIKNKIKAESPADETETTTASTESEELNPLTVDTKFDITHTGSGTGIVGITGKQTNKFNVIIKISKSGVLGTAKVVYSTDNGKTWMPETAIPLVGKINLYYTDSSGSQSDSGLVANFNVNILDQEKGFVKGDTYSTYTCDPTTSLEISHTGSGALNLNVSTVDPTKHVFDVLYNAKKSIQVNVLRAGTLGTAVIQVSTDGGKTYGAQMYLPKNGIITLKDCGIILTFAKSDNNLIAGDTYSVIPVKKTNTKIYIAISILSIAALIVFIMFGNFMKSQIPGRGTYKIIPYTPIEHIKKTKKKHKKGE